MKSSYKPISELVERIDIRNSDESVTILMGLSIDKGMPIEQVQQLLGHQKIDTTMHYAMVKQQNVKLAHRKYIG